MKNELLIAINDWLKANECQTYVDISGINREEIKVQNHTIFFIINFENGNPKKILILNNLGQYIYNLAITKKYVKIKKSNLPKGLLYLIIEEDTKLSLKLINE